VNIPWKNDIWIVVANATDVRESLRWGEEATLRSGEKDLYLERKVVHRRRSRVTTGVGEAAGWSGGSVAVPVNACTTCAETS
jgi:hypothetical protein